MHRPSSPFVEHALVFACSAFCLFGPAALPAQQLAPKRTLTTGPAPGCGAARPGQTTVARRNNVEAQRLATTGQEALLVGDQAAARDAFARAAALNPGDERVAYDLARAHEELADASSAIREYCRYLTLTPGGSEAADVRGRLSRLVPRAEQQRAEDVAVAFRLGLALFDDGRFDAASRAFGDVVKNEPTAPEAFFNRGLAQAAAGRRSLALTDLEQYRAAAPTIDDRVQVGRAIEVLRRPVFNPSVALARSLLPGFGQLYTGRPVRGLLLFVATGAAAGMSFTKQTSEREIAYVDPNGVPAPYTERSTKRPYFVPAISAAAGVAVLGMIDAIRYARRSQRGASIVEVRAAGMQSMPGGSAVSLAPAIGINGGPGVLLRARF